MYCTGKVEHLHQLDKMLVRVGNVGKCVLFREVVSLVQGCSTGSGLQRGSTV